MNAAPPVAWQAISFWLFSALLAGLIFLATATYSRTEDAPGVITLDKGVTAIVAPQSGVVVAVNVKDGAAVKAGEPLVTVQSTSITNDGKTTAERQTAALRAKLGQLKEQDLAQEASFKAQQTQIEDQITQLKLLVREISAQISQQRNIVRIAQTNYDNLVTLRNKGFVSNKGILESETILITREQQLSQFKSARQEAMSRLLVSQQQAFMARADLAQQKAGVGAGRADIDRQLSEIAGQQGYRLVAPTNGTVTTITARVGQPTSSSPLMLLMPEGARITAELYVPSSSIGFLKRGQVVRLAVDAFPFEQFGTVDARIEEVSRAGIERTGEGGASVPSFLVRARIFRPTVHAFGQEFPLTPGMTLRARITTRSRSLFEWLFEPLYAVRQR